MATDQFGFPVMERTEEDNWREMMVRRTDPIVPIMEGLQTLANALAVKDQMSPIEPSLARMMMLMGT